MIDQYLPMIDIILKLDLETGFEKRRERKLRELHAADVNRVGISAFEEWFGIKTISRLRCESKRSHNDFREVQICL